MDSRLVLEKERQMQKENAVSVIKKLALGTCVILMVGVCAYAFLILLMAAI